MNKYTHICPTHMYTKKGWGRCPTCRKPLIMLSYRLRVPQKKRKLWDEFISWWSEKNLWFKKQVEQHYNK